MVLQTVCLSLAPRLLLVGHQLLLYPSIQQLLLYSSLLLSVYCQSCVRCHWERCRCAGRLPVNAGLSCPEYLFSRGFKGRLTTKHRCLQESGHVTLSEKLKVVDGSRSLSVISAEYKEIRQKSIAMADGILIGMINNFRMTKREAKEVLHIGSGRWGLGYSLETELGYPCNHRRMK